MVNMSVLPERYRSVAFVTIIGFILFVCSACQRHYRSTYRVAKKIQKMGYLEPDAEYFDVVMTRNSDDQPLPNTTLRILSRTNPIETTSDANAVIRLPISAEMAKENPPMIVDNDVEVGFTYNCTRNCLPNGTSTEFVTLEDKRQLTEDGFSVWFTPEYEDEANATLDLMRKEQELVSETLGLAPVRHGIVLIPETVEGTIYNVSAPGAFPVWCVSIEEFNGGTFEHLSTHEWAEHTLNSRLNLSEHDRRNRIICDGLAEYCAYLRAGIPDHYGKVIEDLQKAGTQTVNLLKSFRYKSFFLSIQLPSMEATTAAGYGLSFSVWYQLCQEYGDDLPATFLEKLGKEVKRDMDAAIRVLEEITGSDSIKKRFTDVNLSEALVIIDSAKKNFGN